VSPFSFPAICPHPVPTYCFLPPFLWIQKTIFRDWQNSSFIK